jgi:hypothetical protein
MEISVDVKTRTLYGQIAETDAIRTTLSVLFGLVTGFLIFISGI